MRLTTRSGHSLEDDWRWEEMIRDLFTWLQSLLAAGDPRAHLASLEACLEAWRPFAEDQRGAHATRLLQWETARRILWCAQRAVRLQGDRDEITRLCAEISEWPEFLEDHRAWALDCMHLLKDAKADGLRRDVAVALCDELLRERGAVVTLRLEVIRPGGGQAFHHPQDALRTLADSEFAASMAAAWKAARALISRQGKETDLLCDGRWRLLAEEEPVQQVKGRSAGAAAMFGWYHALTGTVPDPIIVMALIDDSGGLNEVGGVSAKVRAVAACEAFDTIVVAGEDNRREADRTLRELGKLGSIRVVIPDARDA